MESNVVAGVELLLPENDEADPIVSIVVPAMNESMNIAEFIQWAKEGLRSLSVPGEVLIVDSSDDETPFIAQREGARVLRVPRRGLGRAYIDSIPYIRGELVILGDADCTYDFRDLRPFYEAYESGSNFVMGSRYQGSIERGAMPLHHQYFGTPLTTWILNRIFRSEFTDIHCGMRGLSLDLLKKMNLQSQSWEYASEMVIKAVQIGAAISEVPVTFLKDRNGRLSHHRREGWRSPYKAAWINLRAMFTNGFDHFLVRPGLGILLLGLLLLLPLTFGSKNIDSLTFSLNWQLLGSTLTVLGSSMFMLGVNSRVLFDFTGEKSKTTARIYDYNPAMLRSALITALGLWLLAPLIWEYIRRGLTLNPNETWRQHLAITGLTFLMVGGLYAINVFLAHALLVRSPQKMISSTEPQGRSLVQK